MLSLNGATACWECEVEGVWHSYPTELSSKLDDALANDTLSVCFTDRGFEYEVSIDSMLQFNSQTGTSRNVRRRIVASPESCDAVPLPEHWVPNQPDQNCDLVQITAGSEEWLRVTSFLHKTMPHAAIIQLHRIQNISLWKFYTGQKNNMELLLGHAPSQKVVWHGTKDIDPAKIYKDKQDGFMMQKSSQNNMWGKGIYFAKNASYSDNYAYKCSRTKQLLLVKLLVGDSVKLQNDSSLLHPPQKPDGSELRFDTVVGETKGSKVYVVYENKRAYPDYRITYTT